MRSRQRGVTFIGWIFLLLPMALVLYAGIRLTPVYLNYMKVAKALEGVSQEFAGDTAVSQRDIRIALERRFVVDSIDDPTARDIAIRREGEAWVVEADYEAIAPLFANASILLQFNRTATID
jgi:hypothetical protein